MSDGFGFPFSAIVGQEEMKRALLLAAVDPAIGGVLIEGPRGTAKSTMARALAELLPEGRFITLPLGTTEERLIGSLDLEKVLGQGEVAFSPGLLHAAHQGVLYVDEVNLLPDHLVDVLLDVAAAGINRVERDGVSHAHPSRFVLVGTMNPDEGELRPQLLDRFGLCVTLDREIDPEARMEIVRRRLGYDADPTAFRENYAPDQQTLALECKAARSRLHQIPLDESSQRLVAEICHQARVEGVRADLVMLRAARAHAAWSDHSTISRADIERVAELALRHRRSDPPPPPPRADRRPEPRQGTASEAPASGESGELPPQVAMTGPQRDIGDLLKKKSL